MARYIKIKTEIDNWSYDVIDMTDVFGKSLYTGSEIEAEQFIAVISSDNSELEARLAIIASINSILPKLSTKDLIYLETKLAIKMGVND